MWLDLRLFDDLNSAGQRHFQTQRWRGPLGRDTQEGGFSDSFGSLWKPGKGLWSPFCKEPSDGSLWEDVWMIHTSRGVGRRRQRGVSRKDWGMGIVMTPARRPLHKEAFMVNSQGLIRACSRGAAIMTRSKDILEGITLAVERSLSVSPSQKLKRLCAVKKKCGTWSPAGVSLWTISLPQTSDLNREPTRTYCMAQGTTLNML